MHQKEKPRRIDPNLVDQLVQKNKLSASLRHLHLLPVLHEAHKLGNDDTHPMLVYADTFQARAEADCVAMMVRSPDIDRDVKFPLLKFVPVIHEIGEKIRRLAGISNQHAVFRVAKFFGTKPERSIMLVRKILFL